MGGDFQGFVCLGTSISAPLLLWDLLGMDLLGAVRQGCIVETQFVGLSICPSVLVIGVTIVSHEM